MAAWANRASRSSGVLLGQRNAELFVGDTRSSGTYEDFVFKPVQLRDGLVILDPKLLLGARAPPIRLGAMRRSVRVFNWVPHERSLDVSAPRPQIKPDGGSHWGSQPMRLEDYWPSPD